MKTSLQDILSFPTIALKNWRYKCTVLYQAQLNYAIILLKDPTSEALGMEKDDDEEVKFSYLAICRFTTLLMLSGNNIYTDHLEIIKNNFWVVLEG